MFSERKTIHHNPFEFTLSQLESAVTAIGSVKDPSEILFRITAIQNVVLKEIRQRRMHEVQKPTA